MAFMQHRNLETAASAYGNKIQRGHSMYRDGKHSLALAVFSEAFATAETKEQRIALHSNRAACYLKLKDFKNAAEEFTSVLELDHTHTGALMLRAQTSIAMKEYHSALFDVHRLIELHPSSNTYLDLEASLKSQLCLAPILECEEEVDLPESEEEEQAEEIVVNFRFSLIANTEVEQTTESLMAIPREKGTKESKPQSNSKGWKAISKPKVLSGLDYSGWKVALVWIILSGIAYKMILVGMMTTTMASCPGHGTGSAFEQWE